MKQRFFGMLDHQIVDLGRHDDAQHAQALAKKKYGHIYLVFDQYQVGLFKKQLDSLTKGKWHE